MCQQRVANMTEMEHAPMPSIHITDFNRFMSFQSILVHQKECLERLILTKDKIKE